MPNPAQQSGIFALLARVPAQCASFAYHLKQNTDNIHVIKDALGIQQLNRLRTIQNNSTTRSSIKELLNCTGANSYDCDVYWSFRRFATH